MKNCLNSEKNQSLYPFVRMTKQTEVIVQAYNFVNYEQIISKSFH
jgi:hypothetical protein